MQKLDTVLVGQRITKQRQLKGLSREKLAEMSDITPRFCYDLELGLKHMSIGTLLKICNSLDVSVDYLLFGPESDSGIYGPVVNLIKTCPQSKLEHLEQIVSQYLQAIREDETDH